MFFSLNQKVKKRISWLITFIIIIFILFHLKNFLFREKIILNNNLQENNKIVTQQDYWTLSGKGVHIKHIFINKKEYFMDGDNNFSIKLYLFSGMNIFNLKAITESGNTITKKVYIFRKT